VSDCPFTLPPRGQEIYREVFDAAKNRGATDVQAAKRAWKIVRRSYRKKGDRWLARKPAKESYAAHGRVIKI